MAQGVTEKLVGAIALAEDGNTGAALTLLEQVMWSETGPLVCSYLAYCTAVERGDISNAVVLLHQVIRSDGNNPVHHLNLGRVYLHVGRRAAALRALRDGLKRAPHEKIVQLIETMGVRQAPPLPFLERNHPLNKLLGKLRHQIARPRTPDLPTVTEKV